MTNKIEKLIEKCKSIIPLEGRILIHPLKLKTYKETQVFPTGIPYPEDEKELIDEIPEGTPENEEFPDKEDPVIQTEEKEIKISKRFQEAIVLKLPEGETRFNIGDTIVYNVGSIFEFDFIKGVSVICKYDPVALLA